jgi:hypothetical protein
MKAFPTAADNGHSENQDGMDLRDYFAAAALQGFLANPNYQNLIAEKGQDWVQESVFAWADSMMSARND